MPPLVFEALAVILVCTAASIIQRVSGFGFGIFAMMFFPHILNTYGEANALSGLFSIFLSGAVALTVLRHVHWKSLIFTSIGNTVVIIPIVCFVLKGDSSFLILLLGIALVALSVYFFFFSSKVHFRPTWYGGLLSGGLSGLLGGLFAMGGPPVVVYFMQSEKDSPKVYLATIQMYFLISNLIGTGVKAVNGFVTLDVLILCAFGLCGIALGIFIGKKIFNKLNAAMLRKVVYGFMAISGVVNIVTYFLP